jgi:pheromone shutdown-related protein TraB
MNCRPGAEMVAAVNAANARKITCSLADREISITLRRALSSLGVWGFCKLLFSGTMGMLQKSEKIGEEEIERLKSSDDLEEILREFGSLLPNVQKALITERDIFLAQKIRETPGEKIVAVVGAAHVPGIKRYITADSDLTELLTVPPKSLALRILGWAFPALIVAGMAYALFTSGSEGFTKALTTWFWMTGVAGALGAAVVRGHPLTIIASFIAAPIASLHPLLATGWVAGLVEALVRKPRVQDLETIAEDMSSLKGMLSNRVSRTLLIVASTNLFVMGGMALAARAVFSIASGGNTPTTP